LPQYFIEQAHESIKSVYSLDFLDINKPVSERDLEKAMVQLPKALLCKLPTIEDFKKIDLKTDGI
jgi:predicted nuclease of restriction endonuclease-like (RecB) superfamily